MTAIRCAVLIVVVPLLASCGSQVAHPSPEIPAQTMLRSVPDDPCALLSAEQVARVSGVAVLGSQRTNGLEKVIAAQRENRPADPRTGTICSYPTTSRFGDIV